MIYIKMHRDDGTPKFMSEMIRELDALIDKLNSSVCRFPVPYVTLNWDQADWDRHIAVTCQCAKHVGER